MRFSADLVVASLVVSVLCGCRPEKVECGGDMPPPVHGRDYWTYCGYNPFTSRREPTDRRFDVPEMRSRKVFTDCALVMTASAKPNPDGPYWPRITDEFTRMPWMLEAIESGDIAGRPFVINVGNRRVPRRAFYETAPLDTNHWFRWKAAHPDFVCFRSTAEIFNDTFNIIAKAPTNSIWRKWAKADRDGMTEAIEYHYHHQVASHFGDESACIGFRGVGYSADFICGANGARALVGETTATSGRNHEWRWNVSAMFIRGASRQFDIPWMWYVALFVNGMRQDGTWQNESWPFALGKPFAASWEHGGISASLLSRVLHFAYFSGANATECEGWNQCLYKPGPDKKFVWTDLGRAFADYHDFTDRHRARGVPYAPVALLIPYNQCYSALGGVPLTTVHVDYTADDLAVDAMFFTLMPGVDREAALREGREGYLRNSRFAAMHDVMVPDSPQDPDEFLAALKRHPVAVIAGRYKRRTYVDGILEKYKAAGGRVIEAPRLTCTPGAFDEVNTGRRTFPEYADIFARIQDELFPFAVSGDVLYGANKTERGWWLWAINNRGVTKWTDTKAVVDEKAFSEISVDLKDVRARSVRELVSGRNVATGDGKFKFIVPAGGVTVFDITEE